MEAMEAMRVEAFRGAVKLEAPVVETVVGVEGDRVAAVRVVD